MPSSSDLRIVHLQDKPEAAETLALWFLDEWASWYGPAGSGDLQGDLAAYRGVDRLPICLLALSADEAVLGTASLKVESVGSEHAPGPWLSAMLVRESHRGRQIGSALVATIESEAVRLGFPSIYASTDTATGILRRRGWQAIGTTNSLRGTLTVLRWTAPARRRR